VFPVLIFTNADGSNGTYPCTDNALSRHIAAPLTGSKSKTYLNGIIGNFQAETNGTALDGWVRAA
jgi:hypothetical protein